MERIKIAFIWQGFDGRYSSWGDGLWAAMQLLEREHEVRYFDFPLTDIYDFAPDVVLYWESPLTIVGKDRLNYWAVQQLPFKKALLFAGGEVRKEWCEGFDLFFVESKINEEDFEAIGLPWRRAFGVNTQTFKPEPQPKVFDGVFHATCASWKRHWLMAEALHEKAAICGRYQSTDPLGFERSKAAGALVLPELSPMATAALINAAHTVVNCASFWGGGQRCTLEAMACGVPPIVMDDSPKNCEYVEESGAGMICAPDSPAIKYAVEMLKSEEPKYRERGLAYIQSKWTERHYADALLTGIKDIL